MSAGRGSSSYKAISDTIATPAMIPARLTSLSAILGNLAPAPAIPAAAAPREITPAELLAERIARLEALELELYQLLASTAPATWRELRSPLVRLLRRARRNLRAVERTL